jgi:putative serine protease PepD
VTGTQGAGTGSGVILDKEGYVLTNNHVVTLDGASSDAKITVQDNDGNIYPASIVGTDPTVDMAVIKIEGKGIFTPIEWADSSKLNVGDLTIALGAPLGLAGTVTTGIVSALNRSIQVASSSVPESSGSDSGNGDSSNPFNFDFGQGPTQSQSQSSSISIPVIQTDAAINPGNSGGALLDSKGRLIGINVAIASAGSSEGQSGSIGVGFALPSNLAKRVSGELIENQKASHGLLGAQVSDAASKDGSTAVGAYIEKAVDGGAAAAAGIKAGDIVTQFNGVRVTDANDLTALVRTAAGGSDATVVIIRDGKQQTIKVQLGTL